MQFGLQFTTVRRDSGRIDQGRGSAGPIGATLSRAANAVDRYSTEVQQRPRAAASSDDRQHSQLAGTTAKRPAAPLVGTKRPLVDPATPPHVFGHRRSRRPRGPGLPVPMGARPDRQLALGDPQLSPKPWRSSADRAPTGAQPRSPRLAALAAGPASRTRSPPPSRPATPGTAAPAGTPTEAPQPSATADSSRDPPGPLASSRSLCLRSQTASVPLRPARPCPSRARSKGGSR